ncbi:MAG: hypothetical protein ACYTGN_01975 [Planctomycetota bacterium]|jgi:uncharacterized membrane protein YkoI
MTKTVLLLALGMFAACASKLPGELVELYDMGMPNGWMEIEAERDGTIIELEADIEIADVPAVVMDAAKKALPGGQVTGAEYEIVGTRRAYEVKMSKGGRGYEFVFTPAGELVESEMEITSGDAPKGLIEAGVAVVKGSAFKSVEVIEANGVKTYHVKTTRGGASYKIVLSAEGTVLRAVREAKAEIEIPLKRE